MKTKIESQYVRSGLAVITQVLVLILATAMSAYASEELVDQPLMDFQGDRLATSVFINGEGPFAFLIDTGSSRTALLAHTAEALGLKPTGAGKITIHSMADSSVSDPYVLQELRLSNETITDLTVAVLRDPSTRSAVPDGILGIDVLTRYGIVIDRAGMSLKLYKRDAGLPRPFSDWRSVRISPRRLSGLDIEFWFFDVTYNGWKAETLFDLGSGITILNWELAEHLVDPIKMPARHDALVRDAIGHGIPGFKLVGVDIRADGFSWRAQDVVAADAPIFKLLDLGDRPAAIAGSGLLKKDSFALDFEKHRLYIRRGE